MTYRIECPACSQSLNFPNFKTNAENFSESICTKCHYKYALLPTRVVKFVSYIEVKPESENNYDQNKRLYKLRLLETNGAIRAVEFETRGKSEKISALADDEFWLLYTMCCQALVDLVWIRNCTSNQNHLLLHPGAKVRSFGFNVAGLIWLASFFVASVLNIPINQKFYALTVPTAASVGLYVTKRQSIKVRDRLELRRLSSEQHLLAQKYDLEQKLAQLTQEWKANQKIIQRLKALQQKMTSADADMYTRRIATVASGIKVIEDQLDLVQKLVDGYSQLVKIIEIEYETSQLAEKLPSDFTSQVLTRLDELKLIEAQKEELALRVDPQKLLSEV